MRKRKKYLAPADPSFAGKARYGLPSWLAGRAVRALV